MLRLVIVKEKEKETRSKKLETTKKSRRGKEEDNGSRSKI